MTERVHFVGRCIAATSLLFALSLMSTHVLAQRGDPVRSPPPTRAHTVVQSSGKPELVSANQQLANHGTVQIVVEGDKRIIRANGIPGHLAGQFPNRGNPHRIGAQRYHYRLPARPQLAGRITALGLQSFGIAVNGVVFDPGAAEWFRGVHNSRWRYEALSGAVRLGLDQNFAHVQPNGAYHYHALPIGLLRQVGWQDDQHSPLIGWAADGFPIYAVTGYVNARDATAGIRAMRSGYRLRHGHRPSGGDNPGGKFDGTFVSDYEFVRGYGDLDECNGRNTATPGSAIPRYAYFLTERWPVIPRCFKGTPSRDFERRRGRGGHRHRHR